MFDVNQSLAKADPQLWAAVQAENARQEAHIELIASENYTSPAVMQAQGSQLTNKYAEGYPGRRYYGGCEHVDTVETLAIERLKKLFGAEAANVQPNSGSQANQAVMMAFLNPGDRILGMSLAEGGHLTHGMPLNMSGKWFEVSSYGLDADEAIDYDAMEETAHRDKPKLIIAGASAYSLKIDFERFSKVARDVGAVLMVDMAHYAGLVAAKEHDDPVAVADVVTTTTHKTLRGPRAGLVLAKKEYAKVLNSRVFPGVQGGPLMHDVAGKAICFGEALRPSFKEYIQQVKRDAVALAETLVAGGLNLVSGGTENHLMLVDVTPLGIGGKTAEDALHACGVTVNMNMIPFDERKPMDPSGIRVGTPALTTRGMGEEEMRTIGGWMLDGLKSADDAAKHATIREQVRELCVGFPVPAAELNAELESVAS